MSPPTAVDAPEVRLLRELHDAYAGVLWHYVLGLVDGDRARAYDVVQETFIRAWRHPQVLDESRGSARRWLFTVAKRIVIDQWRRSARQREVLTATLPDSPGSDEAQQVVDRQLVLAALRALSAEHRQVIVECYYRGASISEAAARLGVPPGTVKSRAHYALHALRRALDDLGGIR